MKKVLAFIFLIFGISILCGCKGNTKPLYLTYNIINEEEVEITGFSFSNLQLDLYTTISYDGIVLNIPEIIDEYRVVKIGDEAFYNKNTDEFDNSLEFEKLILPETLKRIGKRAFMNNYRLFEIVAPEYLFEIGVDAFSNTDFIYFKAREGYKEDSRNSNELVIVGGIIIYCGWTASFPSDVDIVVHEIAEGAYSQCRFLSRYYLDFPIKIIRKGAFKYSNIQGISLPYTLKIIEDEAFYFCEGLSEIKIPASVEYVGNDAFKMAINRRLIIYIEGDKIPEGWHENWNPNNFPVQFYQNKN